MRRCRGLISQYRATGRVEDRRRGPKRPCLRRYTKADIVLLAELDATLGGLCGAATRRVMQRQYEVFGDARFEHLAGFSTTAICTVFGSRQRGVAPVSWTVYV